MLVFMAVLILALLIPEEAYAWGAGFHLQLGISVLRNLQAISPVIATILSEYPNDFLYGCIAADITLAKKFTHYLQHCHRWSTGMKLLEQSKSRPQKACAYGYLTHLAADTIAHNYFVPYKVMRSFPTLTMKHTYWEMRFDSFVEKELWEIGRKVSTEHYKDNDAMLRDVVSKTLFSFTTNNPIFNLILLVRLLERWQKVIKTYAGSSRHLLEIEDRNEYAALAEEAALDFLNNQAGSQIIKADPTGERAILTAAKVRKNLRILYKSGKIAKPEAMSELEEIKKKLRLAICNPELLQDILSNN